jgi:hypothetical protein
MENHKQIQNNLANLDIMHQAGDSIFLEQISESKEQSGDHVIYDDKTGDKIILRVITYQKAYQILCEGGNISAVHKESKLGKAILEG